MHASVMGGCSWTAWYPAKSNINLRVNHFYAVVPYSEWSVPTTLDVTEVVKSSFLPLQWWA